MPSDRIEPLFKSHEHRWRYLRTDTDDSVDVEIYECAVDDCPIVMEWFQDAE